MRENNKIVKVSLRKQHVNRPERVNSASEVKSGQWRMFQAENRGPKLGERLLHLETRKD